MTLLLVLIFGVAGALIGDGVAGSLGAGIGWLAGAGVACAVDYYAEKRWPA